ncbi:MAG: hypothetical protein NC123_13270 [Butyrivibrio sp.]|nr:hypothetical protein [Acetatifactor muris]MCM1560491.1 hypothetical protein [Butyrivibrio sp.]
MKKWIGILLAACMLLMTGCGDSERVIDGEVSNAPGGASQTAGDSAGTQSGGSQAAAKGYVFQYNGVTVSVDEDMAVVLEGLGEARDYFEAASCAFEGLDKTYTYGSFVIETYPQGEKDYVSTIILKDDAVSTAENISIGSTLTDVTNAYGTDYTEQGSMLVYYKDGMKLCILVENDTVTSIQYFSTVLDE